VANAPRRSPCGRATIPSAVSDVLPESSHDAEWPSWEDQLGEAADLDLDALFEDEKPVEELELGAGDEQF
jgi:hypothetical protein